MEALGAGQGEVHALVAIERLAQGTQYLYSQHRLTVPMDAKQQIDPTPKPLIETILAWLEDMDADGINRFAAAYPRLFDGFRPGRASPSLILTGLPKMLRNAEALAPAAGLSPVKSEQRHSKRLTSDWKTWDDLRRALCTGPEGCHFQILPRFFLTHV